MQISIFLIIQLEAIEQLYLKIFKVKDISDASQLNLTVTYML